MIWGIGFNRCLILDRIPLLLYSMSFDFGYFVYCTVYVVCECMRMSCELGVFGVSFLVGQKIIFFQSIFGDSFYILLKICANLKCCCHANVWKFILIMGFLSIDLIFFNFFLFLLRSSLWHFLCIKLNGRIFNIFSRTKHCRLGCFSISIQCMEYHILVYFLHWEKMSNHLL